MKEEREIFKDNLSLFLKQNGYSQNQFAKLLGLSNASISNYLKGVSEPTLSFFYKFKKIFKLPTDYFFSQNTTNEIQIVQSPNIARFSGNYLLYFYDSGSYIGNLSSKTKSPLKYGILSLVGDNKFKAYTLFYKDEKSAISAKEFLDSSSNLEILSFYNINENSYEGECEISASQLFIKLKSFNDNTLIILNNPPSNKVYIGGLGTVNSVSRGREHSPCIQFILISRNILNLSEGEIYNLLALDIPNVNLHFESEKLVDLFKNLYLANNTLEEYQKKKIFENSLENAFSNSIEANVFRYAKVTGREDDYFYNIIRGV